MTEKATTYAVIRTGGKQYRVIPGQRVHVEKLEQNVGDEITFSDVLFLKDGEKSEVGRPTVSGAAVSAKGPPPVPRQKSAGLQKTPQKRLQKTSRPPAKPDRGLD
jgi:ribosomal protein L21